MFLCKSLTKLGRILSLGKTSYHNQGKILKQVLKPQIIDRKNQVKNKVFIRNQTDPVLDQVEKRLIK